MSFIRVIKSLACNHGRTNNRRFFSANVYGLNSTGIKCIPINQVAQADGATLHDWHAEIVALRTFNHYLLCECLELATSPDKISPIIRIRGLDELSEDRGLQPFSIHDDLELHMYSSEAPCGDASMELVIEAQVDPKPWSLCDDIERTPGMLRGRAGFAELGIVRRKPGRDLTVCMIDL